MRARSSERSVAAVVLVLALACGLALRAVAIAEKPAVTHDEAISYLAATCHQRDWERVRTRGLPPAATWTTAGEWRELVEPDRFACLGRIGDDLSRHDIHPPLYFWLLHVWVAALGVGTATGAALNLPIFVATAAALFGLGRRLLANDLHAASVVFVWAVSPAVVPISAEARMYDLVALIAVLFAWQVVRVAGAPRAAGAGGLALLALVTAAGTLTAFTFPLVALAGAAWLVLRLARRDRGRLGVALAALVAGFALFLVVHPHFASSLEQQQEQVRVGFSLDRLPARLDRTAEAFVGFALPAEVVTRGVARVVFGLAALAAAVALARRRPRLPRDAAAALLFAAVAVAGTTLLYLSFRSHGLAIGGKYMATAWPFVAFVPVLALRRRPAILVAACAALLGAGLVAALTLWPDAHPPRAAPSARVVVDTTRRGVLIPIVLQLPERQPLYAAPQRELIRRPERWLARLRPGDLYVADTTYGKPAERRAILALIGRRHRTRDAPGGFAGADNRAFVLGGR